MNRGAAAGRRLRPVVPTAGHVAALGRVAVWASAAAAVAFVLVFFGVSFAVPAMATSQRWLLSECQPGLRKEPSPVRVQPEPDIAPVRVAVPLPRMAERPAHRLAPKPEPPGL